ncbi:MAG: translocation/assembly module TamB [Candidatus Cloacimonetes bacterium]|nr:translocation/assembly module TamB [Candidatus Cloacimonadota bacterium]MDD2649809.1 translocation/assembly module TamB [Candidatus Cloacimonadota bacterium]
MKKVLLISSIIIFSIFMLLILTINVLYFSNLVQNKVLQFGINFVNKSFPADIYVENMEGNLFKSFTLNNIVIIYNDEQMLSLQKLAIQLNRKKHYRLFTDLGKRKISIENIRSDSLICNVITYPDSSINILKAFQTNKESEPSNSVFGVYLKNIELKNYNVYYTNRIKNKQFDDEIKSLDLSASAIIQNNKTKLMVSKLSFTYDNSQISLDNISYLQDNQSQQADIEMINIRNSSLSAKATKNEHSIDFKISGYRINTKDINYFTKSHTLKPLYFSFEARGSLADDAASAQLNLNTPKGCVDIIANSNNVKNYQINTTIIFDDFNPLQFTQDEIANLSGELNIETTGANLQNDSFKIELKQVSAKYDNYQLNDTYLNAILVNNKADIELNTTINSEENTYFNTSIQVDNIFNEDNSFANNISFIGNLNLVNLNPNIFVEHAELNRSLDINSEFKGRGIDLFEAELSLFIKDNQDTESNKTSFESLNLNIQKSNQNFIAKLNIINPSYDSIFARNIQIETNLNTDYKQIIHPSKLDFTINELFAYNNSINNISLFSQTKQTNTDIYVENQLSISASDSLNLDTSFSFKNDEISPIEISNLSIDLGKIQLNNLYKAAKLSFLDNIYSIENLSLQIDEGSIDIDASLKDNNYVSVCLKVSDLPLQLSNLYLPQKAIEKGYLDWQLDISNTLSKPIIDSKLSIKELTVVADTLNKSNIDIKDISINLKQTLDSLYTNSSIRLKDNVLNIVGTLPIYLSHSDKGNDAFINKDKQFNLSLFLEKSNLQSLNNLLEPKFQIDGDMSFNLSISNTINNPQLIGTLLLCNAGFKYPEYGTDLKNIYSSLSIKPNNVNLDSLTFNVGKGRLFANGKALFNYEKGFSIDSLKIDITSKQAHFLNSSALNSKINSEISVTGNKDYLFLNSSIKLIDTKVNVDHLSKSKSSFDLSTPLLMQNKSTEKKQSGNAKELKLPEFKKANINIKLDIPRNTWISGKDMNFELTGLLHATSEKENIFIDGEVEILRGHYSLYGKRFNIEDAKIIFINDKDLNPVLDIKASYKFREENNRRTLYLLISGNLHSPSLSFFLDSEQISEADAVSYIIFGKNMNELSNREQSSVGNEISAESIATSLLLNNITSSLNNKIKDALHLDLAEITGYNQYGNTEIQIGKYFGDRVFISYIKEFNIFDTQSSQNESVNLEYQISKRFYLQSEQSSNKSSGIDLIFKWESK